MNFAPPPFPSTRKEGEPEFLKVGAFRRESNRKYGQEDNRSSKPRESKKHRQLSHYAPEGYPVDVLKDGIQTLQRNMADFINGAQISTKARFNSCTHVKTTATWLETASILDENCIFALEEMAASGCNADVVTLLVDALPISGADLASSAHARETSTYDSFIRCLTDYNVNDEVFDELVQLVTDGVFFKLIVRVLLRTISIPVPPKVARPLLEAMMRRLRRTIPTSKGMPLQLFNSLNTVVLLQCKLIFGLLTAPKCGVWYH